MAKKTSTAALRRQAAALQKKLGTIPQKAFLKKLREATTPEERLEMVLRTIRNAHVERTRFDLAYKQSPRYEWSRRNEKPDGKEIEVSMKLGRVGPADLLLDLLSVTGKSVTVTIDEENYGEAFVPEGNQGRYKAHPYFFAERLMGELISDEENKMRVRIRI